MTGEFHDYGDELLRVPVMALSEIGDPYALGVDREAPQVEDSGYVKRDQEETLREGIEAAYKSDEPRLVALVGPSNAGKTRTLYEVASKAVPDAIIVAPRDASSLAALLDPGKLTGLSDE